MKTKQVRLSELPGFVNQLVQKGMHITRCVKNGNTDNAYVLVEYCDMAMMVTIARRVLHNAEWNETYHQRNTIKVDELTNKI